MFHPIPIIWDELPWVLVIPGGIKAISNKSGTGPGDADFLPLIMFIVWDGQMARWQPSLRSRDSPRFFWGKNHP